MKKLFPDFTFHARAMLALGLPLVGSQVAIMLLHVVDTVLMGRYDVTALAAMVLGSSYFFVIFVLGSGFGTAVPGMVAAAVGQRDPDQARRDTRMALWWSLLFAIAVLPLFWWAEPILLAMGQRPELAAEVQTFTRIAGFGMAPALGAVALRGFLSALERTRVVFWNSVLSLGLNAVLAWALIFGRLGLPEMGLRGAALATVAVQGVTLAVYALHGARAPSLAQYQLFRRVWRPDWPAFVMVARLGMPIGLTALAESGLFAAAAMMMGWVGTVELAAHGIAIQIAAIAFMVHTGLSQAATVRVGIADGRGDPEGLAGVARTAILLSLVFALVAVTLFLTVPRGLVGLYVDPSKPETPRILDFGVKLMAMAALFQIFDAMQVMALGLLRGVRDTRVPMWMAIISYWGLGMPVSYVLAFVVGWGGLGLWAGLVAGLACASGLLMLRFWSGQARAAVRPARA